MSIDQGLLCEFYKNKWSIIIDYSPSYSSVLPQSLLSCDIGYYHSTDVANSFISFYFSKLVYIHSYFIYSENSSSNSLFNWDLKYVNQESNTFSDLDSQRDFETRGNTKIIKLKTPVITNMVKLIGGKDRENDNYYVKFDKIEFYGWVITKSSCKDSVLLSNLTPLLYIFILNYNN